MAQKCNFRIPHLGYTGSDDLNTCELTDFLIFLNVELIQLRTCVIYSKLAIAVVLATRLVNLNIT